MDQNTEFSNLMHDIIHSGMMFMERAASQPEDALAWLGKAPGLYTDLHTVIDYLTQHPQILQEYYSAYFQEAQHLLHTQLQCWSGMHGVPSLQTDRRFAAKEWASHPFFQLISQHYVLLEAHLLRILAQIPTMDQQSSKRIHFLIQQYYHALSPENFLLTNPQLLTETLQNNGLNLLRGLHHFLQDLQTQSSQHWTMPLADMGDFIVGKSIAITPGKVVYQNDLIELIQYTPQTPALYAVPLLVIPPWINKYYILDLRPENSLVRWLVEQGIVVFMISWRNPDSSHAHWGLREYLSLGPIAAIEQIQQQLNIPKVSTLGFCIGGTLLSMLLAYYKAQNIDAIASATLLASLIDFSDPGELGVFIHEQQIQAMEYHMQQQGYLEGDAMAAAFYALRPGDLIWRVFVQRYLLGHAPRPMDLLCWNMDTTNMPAKMHSEYLRSMYLANDLIKPGKIQINQIPLDITQIDVPAFFLSTQKDHIAPWQSTYRGFDLLAGPKKFILGGSGHIAGIVIPPGKDKYGYYSNPDYPQQPEDWMQNTQFTAGSWWPEWFDWLKIYSGHMLDSLEMSTQLATQALADAPGSYVHVKSAGKFE